MCHAAPAAVAPRPSCPAEPRGPVARGDAVYAAAGVAADDKQVAKEDVRCPSLEAHLTLGS